MPEFDLNLLRVFDLLYEEGSVTRAAARLHVTQSAVSHALARLRDVLDDPLFVKVPNGLRPTERAHQLAPQLRVAFADIRSVVCSPVFDPATSNRHFRVAAGTYFNDITVNLIGLLRRDAPNVTLQVTEESLDLTEVLDQQLVDIVLGGFDKVPSRFRSEVLFQDKLVWVIGTDNPLASRTLDHKTLLAQPRLSLAATQLPERTSTPLRDKLVRLTIAGLDTEREPADSLGQSRRMAVYDVDCAIAAVAASDMVALVPGSYARIWANSHRIKVVELPKGRLKPVEITMTWHSRFHDEPSSVWLRQSVRDAAKLAAAPAQSYRASRLSMESESRAHKRKAEPRRAPKVRRAMRVSR